MTALHAASRGARLVAFASALAACASTVSEPTAGGGGGATSTGSGGATTSSQGGAGGATTSSQGGAGGGGGATTTAQGGAGGAGGTTAAGGAGGAGGVVPPPDCGALTDALVPIVAGPGACTAVVRLAYTTKKPLGFELVCGKYAKVDEASARATAQADTGWGADAKTISPPFPGDPDVFVFFEEPLDFGGLAAVSADTGQSVFGGGVVWSGTGDVTWPKTWRPAADLGVGCTPPPGIVPPPVRGFDFSSGGAQPLAPADAQAAFAVAFDSAITGAYAKTLYLRDSMVLLYPRTVGLFDPTNAEWVVLYNAYWLE